MFKDFLSGILGSAGNAPTPIPLPDVKEDKAQTGLYVLIGFALVIFAVTVYLVFKGSKK